MAAAAPRIGPGPAALDEPGSHHAYHQMFQTGGMIFRFVFRSYLNRKIVRIEPRPKVVSIEVSAPVEAPQDHACHDCIRSFRMLWSVAPNTFWAKDLRPKLDKLVATMLSHRILRYMS